jgi:hypothetical protein
MLDGKLLAVVSAGALFGIATAEYTTSLPPVTKAEAQSCALTTAPEAHPSGTQFVWGGRTLGNNSGQTIWLSRLSDGREVAIIGDAP